MSPKVSLSTTCRTNRLIGSPMQPSSDVQSGCRITARHKDVVGLDMLPRGVDDRSTAMPEGLAKAVATSGSLCLAFAGCGGTSSSMLRCLLRFFAFHFAISISAACRINCHSSGGCPTVSINAVGMQLYGCSGPTEPRKYGTRRR